MGRPENLSVTARVPAKINLHLGVGAGRPDGFHTLNTVYHGVSLADTVTASSREIQRADRSGGLAAQRPTVLLTGPEAAGLDAGPANLAWRAAEALAARIGLPAAVDLTVDKQIPVAAGLAGGSADAAATLLACAALWQVQDATLLHEVAAGLGSDVPFGLRGGTALGTGRGERVTEVATTLELNWVIAAAQFQLSTPAVFAELDRLRHGVQGVPDVADPDRLLSALGAGDLAEVAGCLSNDLQPAALSLAPSLAATLDAGRGAGALAALVSGSGPTCVFLAADAAHATAIAQHLTAHCRFAVTATGPRAATVWHPGPASPGAASPRPASPTPAER